ncbi:right-handed parallel beta-helix repeat-containing protein, partial [Bartonella raoultii]|uniref:right-handed parallel beta-helix repeat-containing protein n=1 Tax=Bartonella raoultii TaxID=1457020 RepID=UPI0035A32B7C
MYKKSLLSSMATAAIVLFNIQFNVHAESLEVSGEKKEVKDATYETLHALKEGQIIGTDLKVTGNKDTNSSSNTNVYVITTEGKGSAIKLTGDKTTIKGTDSDIPFGLEVKDDAILQMTGGTITVSDTGVHFLNTNSTENKLENVTISSGKDDAPLHAGIKTENSTITLENIKVTQTNNAVVANNNSTITVSGGSFDTKLTTIYAGKGSTVILTDVTQITSSKNNGLFAQNGGAISMTGGSIKAFYNGAAFENSKNDNNKLNGVTISSNKDGALLKAGISADQSTVALKNVTVSQAQNAVLADDESTITISGGSFDTKLATIVSEGNSIITLTDNAQITSYENTGLYAKDGGTINMTGGSIKASFNGASFNGASFENSKREENKLENVTISSVKDEDDALLHYGINANKSTIILNNVTVTKAESAIVADDHSIITVFGGSFESNDDGIYAKQASSISLNNATVTSSYGDSVYADGPDSKIIMIEGSATTKNEYSSALLAKNKGAIDATDVTLTTNGTGTGAFAYGEKSTIELHGNTIISNTFNGLGASVGGKITSENLTIIGGTAVNLENPEAQSGVWVGESGEINLTGKTIISNFDEGLYADGGGKIVSGDLTITGGESKEKTVGVSIWEPESKIELNGNTTIQNIDFGLAAGEDATIKTANGTKNEIKAKKNAIIVINGGHMDLANISATAGVAGLQFVNFSDNDPYEHHNPQKYRSNKINLTNTNIHVDNGTGIFVGAVVEKNIENIPSLSIGTISLNNSKIHADILLDDGIFWDKVSWKDKNVWNDENMKEISTGSFTLNADHSILEGRANIAQERNVHFDL